MKLFEFELARTVGPWTSTWGVKGFYGFVFFEKSALSPAGLAQFWGGLPGKNRAELISRLPTFGFLVKISQTPYLNGKTARLSFLSGQFKRKQLHMLRATTSQKM